MHVTAAAILGGIGGAFGFAALPIELPFTTLVILRSIAAIARDSDADLNDPGTRLECISVLSLGGPSTSDDAMDSSYLTSRVGLALLIRDASGFLVGKSSTQIGEALAARGGARGDARLVSAVANRFGSFALADLASAEMVPDRGRLGRRRAQRILREFFQPNRVSTTTSAGLRRLERIYGEQVVQDLYRADLRNLTV